MVVMSAEALSVSTLWWALILEMARAAAGLSPQEGVAILRKINAAERDPSPPAMSFSKLYDTQTLRPCQELVDQYRKFTRIFRDLGLEYPTWTD